MIAIAILTFLYGMIMGLIVGRYIVWQGLRKDRVVVIGKWRYACEPK